MGDVIKMTAKRKREISASTDVAPSSSSAVISPGNPGSVVTSLLLDINAILKQRDLHNIIIYNLNYAAMHLAIMQGVRIFSLLVFFSALSDASSGHFDLQ